MAVRNTQTVAHTLAEASSPETRLSQATMQTLAEASSANVNITQLVMHSLAEVDSSEMRVTQLVKMALVDEPAAFSNNTQSVAMALVSEEVPLEVTGSIGLQEDLVDDTPETLNTLEVDPDFIDNTLALVKDQYQFSENYKGFVRIQAELSRQLEALIVSAAESMLFPNAEGEQLTEIGRQYGVPRSTTDDAQFKAILALEVLKTSNKGSRDDIYSILNEYSAESVDIVSSVQEQLDIYLFSTCISDLQGIKAITNLLPLGTKYRIAHTEGAPFGFGASDEGFGSIHDSTLGGNINGLLAYTEDISS